MACSGNETDGAVGGEAGQDASGGLGNGGTAGNGGSSGASGSSAIGGAGQGPTGGRGSNAEAAYLLGTRVWNDVVTTSYFHVVSSLDEGTRVDSDRALEVPGPAKLFAIDGAGWFALGGGEAPTIARYSLSADDVLVREEALSLANLGVASLWDTIYVVSPTKLYYPDRDGARLIVINPSEMTIEGTVELPETVRDGYLSLYGYTPHLRDGELFFSVGWFDWENDRVLPETGLVVLDTETDAAQFEVDDRCGGITTSVQTESGDAYFVSSALAGATYHVGRLSTEPCALRVRAGERVFDSAYLLRLEDITGVPISGEPIPAGGDTVFLRVLDEELAEIESGAASWNITGQAAWRWWRWDISSGTAGDAGLEPSTADVLWFEVEGRVFGTETKEDYSDTTLIELNAEGGPRRALTAPGFLHGVARVR
jgi:hypothetical protein